MKIFLPMPDTMLDDDPQHSQAQLVPFKPEFLTERKPRETGFKPANWISDCDYLSARKRLTEARQLSLA